MACHKIHRWIGAWTSGTPASQVQPSPNATGQTGKLCLVLRGFSRDTEHLAKGKMDLKSACTQGHNAAHNRGKA
jgi:hypothetical protein